MIYTVGLILLGLIAIILGGILYTLKRIGNNLDYYLEEDDVN